MRRSLPLCYAPWPRFGRTSRGKPKSLPKRLSALILAITIGLMDSGAARAEDLTVVFRTTGPNGEQTVTHYYSADRVRFEQGEESTVVYLVSGRIVFISSRRKQYSETTFAELEQAMTSVSAQMEKAMAALPEGLRQKMMGDAGRDVTLTLGESRTVAGISCQVHTATLGARSRMETCAATGLTLPFDPKHLKNLALVTAPIARGNSGINKLVAMMREIEGLSLASTTELNLLGRKIETAAEALEVVKGPIDPATFDTPPGFQKVESPFTKMAQ